MQAPSQRRRAVRRETVSEMRQRGANSAMLRLLLGAIGFDVGCETPGACRGAGSS